MCALLHSSHCLHTFRILYIHCTLSSMLYKNWAASYNLKSSKCFTVLLTA
ncbi:hypothetical protein BVRB_8g185650 [Beta vulgaris subsp. vulgaris]|nr:hypothetical protein BVRB_8g185650 [Beta vulgaris subsp. vulgaris]